MLVVAIPLMLSPIGVFPINPISDERIIVMDGVFSYDANLVNDVFERLGNGGRRIYTIFHIFDCVFALSYCLLMMALLRPITAKSKKWIWIMFPILPAAFDCIENILIQIMSFQFPSINHNFVCSVSVISSLKWFAILLWLIVFVVMVAIRKSKKTQVMA
jgi:hypothetical protein